MIERWWKEMWALWSIRLGAVVSIVIGWMAAYPDQWQQLVSQLPEQVRPLVGLVAFAVITYSRRAKQGKPNGA